MSDSLPDTGDRARRYCPECEPWNDPLTDILVEDRCATHRPSLAGLDDARLDDAPTLGNSETDAATQHGMARLLARGHP